MKAVGIIPARYASTRLPGKPLLCETGKYLIQHVYERVREARSLSRVVVATDDERIAAAVREFGGEVRLTRADHPSGTDRVAEVAESLDADVIVNVQGDEPEIDPENIDQLTTGFSTDPGVRIGTLACPFPAVADPKDPSAVKVVVDLRGRALYFSRSLIPYGQAAERPARGASAAPASPGPHLLHAGIYAYRRDTLLELATLPPTALEQTEKLEQLRWLEHGYAIHVVRVERSAVGIDTPEDYEAFVRRWRAGVR